MYNNKNDKELRDFHQSTNRKHLEAGYPRQNLIEKEIKKTLKKGNKILEIGFGDGYLLNKLSKGGYEVTGQDLSEINIELTKQQWGNDGIKFIIGDDSGILKCDDNSVGGFVASEVFEHMSNDELKLCVSEVLRTLQQGGYAYVTFPAEENLKLNECSCPNCGEVFHKRGHKQYRNEDKILEIFKDFKIIKIKKFFGRYSGNGKIEKLIGRIMFYIRTILNKVVNIDGKTYLVIVRKK